MWVTAGLSAAGALKGTLDAIANRRAQQEHNKMRAATIENSPWTGMGDPGAWQGGPTSNLAGGLQGGLQGAMVGSLFDGAKAKKPVVKKVPVTTEQLTMNTNPMQSNSPWLNFGQQQSTSAWG